MGDLIVKKFYLDETAGEVWFLINEYYLVLNDLDVKMIQELENKTMSIYIFKTDKTFVGQFNFT